MKKAEELLKIIGVTTTIIGINGNRYYATTNSVAGMETGTIVATVGIIIWLISKIIASGRLGNP